ESDRSLVENVSPSSSYSISFNLAERIFGLISSILRNWLNLVQNQVIRFFAKVAFTLSSRINSHNIGC
ncbi:MAG: hypothetical protein WAK17_29165, partial [Candidatus Nitrosopolaris sp.]